MLNFCDRLKAERNRLGYNQLAFAQKAGVSKTTQFNYEKGDRQPDAVYLAAIAEIGVDVAYLITGSRSLNIDLSPDESALLDNYRHLDEEQKAALNTVSNSMVVSAEAKKEAQG